MRVTWRALLLGSSAVFLQCSLLAPDDPYFLGSGGEAAGGSGGNVEHVCTPALACEPASAEGTVVVLGPEDAADLSGIVANAEPNTTFSLTAGSYPLAGVIAIKAPGITLRSDSGDATDVVLEGSGAPVLVAISASDVTLQDLTLVGASDSAVLVGGGKDVIVERPRLCGVVIQDGGTSFLRTTAEGGWVDCGRVERSSFLLTDEGRSSNCGSGDIISGMSIAGGRGWVVSESKMRDFFCPATMPPPAHCPPDAIGVVFSLRGRDTLIERSSFTGMSRAIALGYTITATAGRSYADDPYDDPAIDHIDGVLRNNLIVGHAECFDTGIELNHARQPTVIHNTVIALGYPGFSTIDRRYPETHVDLINNLLSAEPTVRESAPDEPTTATVTVTDLAEIFLNPAAEDGNFHLKATAVAAIDQGVESDLAGLDLDGQPHTSGRGPDVGAYELVP